MSNFHRNHGLTPLHLLHLECVLPPIPNGINTRYNGTKCTFSTIACEKEVEDPAPITNSLSLNLIRLVKPLFLSPES